MFMLRYIILLLAIFYNASLLHGEEMLSNSIQETRAKKLFSMVRCGVCNGQTINDSNSHLATLLRKEIRTQIINRKTDEEILHSLKVAYGEQVLTTTIPSIFTILLWVLPLIFIMLGCKSLYVKTV